MPRTFISPVSCIVFMLPACLGQQPATRPAGQIADKQSPRPKVGVFTFSGGFKHSCLGLAETTIKELGDKSGAFEAVLHEQYKQDADKLDLKMINADYLKQFAAVLFYTTSGPKDLDLLSEAQREDLMSAIRDGRIAFIGVHSATDTFYKWPEYGQMIGAYFDGHPWNANSPPVTIRCEDCDHPATTHLAESWFLQEEIYQFKEPYTRDKLHVLLSLDTKATDMSLQGVKRTDGDFALAWSKFHGKGHVFYTALGHREDVWTNELFQKHLLGGIRWALGKAKGKPAAPGASALPGAPLPIAAKVGDEQKAKPGGEREVKAGYERNAKAGYERNAKVGDERMVKVGSGRKVKLGDGPSVRPGEEPPASGTDGGLVRMENGIQYADLKVGGGDLIKRFDKLRVSYTGWLLDGTQFDTSYPAKPFEFALGVGEVIPGWDHGLMGMRFGGKRKLIIPSGLAYGAAGVPGVTKDDPPRIPPNAKLVFDVEILEK